MLVDISTFCLVGLSNDKILYLSFSYTFVSICPRVSVSTGQLALIDDINLNFIGLLPLLFVIFIINSGLLTSGQYVNM